MFNLTTGAHKLHKEFVKMKAGAYYYQPQTQLNDKEVICDDMKGAMTLNVGDDIITTWYTRDFPNWLNGLGHTRVKAIAGSHVEDAPRTSSRSTAPPARSSTSTRRSTW